MTVADLNPGRTTQSCQDPAWVLRFMTLPVCVDGEEILHVEGAGTRTQAEQRVEAGRRFDLEGWRPHPTPTPVLFSVPEMLVGDVLEHFLPLSQAGPELSLSSGPSCTGLSPHLAPWPPVAPTGCVQVCPYTCQVTDASYLSQDMPWLSPASAAGDSVPVCSSFLTPRVRL